MTTRDTNHTSAFHNKKLKKFIPTAKLQKFNAVFGRATRVGLELLHNSWHRAPNLGKAAEGTITKRWPTLNCSDSWASISNSLHESNGFVSTWSGRARGQLLEHVTADRQSACQCRNSLHVVNISKTLISLKIIRKKWSVKNNQDLLLNLLFCIQQFSDSVDVH